MLDSLEHALLDVYTKFKLHFYRDMFARFQGREASLSTTEMFCVEIIYDLGTPTVHEFAEFAHISAPNAAYKVNSLIQKGYITKIQSEDDKRKFHLQVTDRFVNYYSLSCKYIDTIIDRAEERFTPEELETFERMLTVISTELTPEINVPLRTRGEIPR